MWNTLGTEEAQQRPDRKLITMRTADNPSLPQDFIERLQATLDERTFRQELLEASFEIALWSGL